MSEQQEEPHARQKAGSQSLQIAGNVNGSALAAAGGVAIIINHVPAQADGTARAEPSVADMVANILALNERERRSFMRFARTSLQGHRLDSLDATTLKRVHAYAAAILSRRAH